jgi:hypothetical protein
MIVCWDDDNAILTASLQTASRTIGVNMSSTPVGGGIFVGLASGSGSAGNEKFDNFEFWKHLSEEEPDCPDCPEFSSSTTTCGDCDSVKSQYTIDLGTTGITDDDCEDCDLLTGEFVLGRNLTVSGGPCVWNFNMPIGFCGTQYYVKFNTRLELLSNAFGRWWSLYIELRTEIGGSSQAVESAWYESGPVADDECEDPQTLTLIQGSGSLAPRCSGSWPNTIDLS